MIDAHNNDDYEKMLDLQCNFESTGRSFFADVEKKENKGYHVKDSDFEREYEYRCINKECADYDKTVYVKKAVKLSGRDELCNTCQTLLQRQYGLGGFTMGGSK